MKLHSEDKYLVIGTMSGTSLDGLDIAAVEFWLEKEKWKFELKASETIEYSKIWREKLKDAPTLPGSKLMQLHSEYGNFSGKKIKKFIVDHGFVPNLISSHGHTVFHQPEKGFTFQLGKGTNIAIETQLTTVADFRSGDVALGGQGAPLVPLGDEMLFSEYDYCLNLGGFANISCKKQNKRIAFDICPVNIVLNFLSEKKGMPYDKGGNFGKAGKTKAKLLDKLNSIPYYLQQPPKSLGREWLEEHFMQIVLNNNYSLEDIFSTIYEHIAFQISQNVDGTGKILVTGGGAFNDFLIKQISSRTSAEIVIPDKKIINYKEAIIFAFLGLLKLLDKINCLASVTGARKDSKTGVIFQP